MNGKQLGFADHEQSMAKKRTKRERFLSEMEAVVPWKALIDLIEPHYPKTSSKGGLPPYPLGTRPRPFAWCKTRGPNSLIRGRTGWNDGLSFRRCRCASFSHDES
ncbi:hypothetical protein VB757_20080, partial [Synechococcus sp. BA-132 BA5]|nr:hypothetical protein [Synechococcus sp. BA-132 BA5]